MLTGNCNCNSNSSCKWMTENEHHYLPPDLDFYHRQKMHESIQHPRGDHDAPQKTKIETFRRPHAQSSLWSGVRVLYVVQQLDWLDPLSCSAGSNRGSTAIIFLKGDWAQQAAKMWNIAATKKIDGLMMVDVMYLLIYRRWWFSRQVMLSV